VELAFLIFSSHEWLEASFLFMQSRRFNQVQNVFFFMFWHKDDLVEVRISEHLQAI